MSNLEQLQLVFVVDEGSALVKNVLILYMLPRVHQRTRTNLDVGLGLVCHLHDELRLRVDHVLKNFMVDAALTSDRRAVGKRKSDSHSAEVVRVGHEEVLLAFRKELVEHARLV